MRGCYSEHVQRSDPCYTRRVERLGQVLVETYRVERLIAEGGMAAVYEAAHVRVPKKFAVKFLKLSLVNNAEALQRFRREAEIIATLDHANIVQLIDYNVDADGSPYIVLEYLDGENLGQRLARGKMDMLEALHIAHAVASALAGAHSRQITHRDLKPENIMLCSGNKVKVLDFGVAKLRHGPELTAFNVVVGTVGFMAPEQISGLEVDHRTDEFALASIVYSMISGRNAFEIEGSITAQAMHILHHNPPEIEGVPASVNEVLQRGMAKHQADRYDSCEEFANALLSAAGDDVGLPPLKGESTTISAPSFAWGSLPRTDPGIPAQTPAVVTSAPTQTIDRAAILPSRNTVELSAVRIALPPPRAVDRPNGNGTSPTGPGQRIDASRSVTAPPMTPMSPSPQQSRTIPPQSTAAGMVTSPPVLPSLPPKSSEGVMSAPMPSLADIPYVTPVSMNKVDPDEHSDPGSNGITAGHTGIGPLPKAPREIPRLLWVIVGAAAGTSLAAVVWLLLH